MLPKIDIMIGLAPHRNPNVIDIVNLLKKRDSLSALNFKKIMCTEIALKRTAKASD
jgi:hypothetical protein